MGWHRAPKYMRSKWNTENLPKKHFDQVQCFETFAKVPYICSTVVHYVILLQTILVFHILMHV